MLNYHHIIPILFGMLFIFTACQKIELDSKKSNNGSSANKVEKNSGKTNENTSPSNETDEETILPDGTIYMRLSNHVIGLEEKINNDSTKVLLISLRQWPDMPTGYSETPTAADDSAKHYEEDKLTGWRIPTREEAKALYNKYSSTSPNISAPLEELNKKLERLKSSPVYPWYDNYDVLRYFCQDAYHSFTLCVSNNGFSIARTGTGTGTGKKYFLRLVKDTIIPNRPNE